MKVYAFSEGPRRVCELVGFSRALGLPCEAIVIGEADEEVVHSGACLVHELIGRSVRPEAYARPLASLLEPESLLLVSATSVGSEVAAFVSGLLEWPLLSGALSLAVLGKRITGRRYQADAEGLAELEMPLPCVVTLASGKGTQAFAGDAARVVRHVVDPDLRVARISIEEVKDVVDLGKADRVIGVGGGACGAQAFAECCELAAALDAEMGCTRMFREKNDSLPDSAMIGITGITVRPRLYIAIGVSGQPQHLYGIRESRIIAAIDRNPDAPIFRECDYGLVGDVSSVLPRLLDALAAR